MIDEYWTFRLYGYHSDELKPKSTRPVVAVCNICSKYRVARYQSYRELCSTCGHADVSGEKNPMFGRGGKDAPGYGKTGDKNPMSGVCGERHPRYGAHHTEKTRRKMIENHADFKGSNHPQWKGGNTEWNIRMRMTDTYKNWRTAVFKRDDYTCQMCNDAAGGNLQAHHIQPIRDHKNDLLIYDIDNGITLCKRCHLSIKGKEHDHISRFSEILNRR